MQRWFVICLFLLTVLTARVSEAQFGVIGGANVRETTTTASIACHPTLYYYRNLDDRERGNHYWQTTATGSLRAPVGTLIRIYFNPIVTTNDGTVDSIKVVQDDDRTSIKDWEPIEPREKRFYHDLICDRNGITTLKFWVETKKGSKKQWKVLIWSVGSKHGPATSSNVLQITAVEHHLRQSDNRTAWAAATADLLGEGTPATLPRTRVSRVDQQPPPPLTTNEGISREPSTSRTMDPPREVASMPTTPSQKPVYLVLTEEQYRLLQEERLSIRWEVRQHDFIERSLVPRRSWDLMHEEFKRRTPEHAISQGVRGDWVYEQLVRPEDVEIKISTQLDSGKVVTKTYPLKQSVEGVVTLLRVIYVTVNVNEGNN